MATSELKLSVKIGPQIVTTATYKGRRIIKGSNGYRIGTLKFKTLKDATNAIDRT